MAVPYSRMCFGVLPWYSVLIVTGMVLAIWIVSREGQRRELGNDLGVDLALACVPLGIICARLYYVVFSWGEYSSNPISALYIREGGLAIYGGVIGGVLGVFLFCRKKHLSFGLMLDLIAPGLALAQSIGRWGNYFNMEAYGPLTPAAGLCFFPASVLISEAGGMTWHLATFFYESVWDFCVFLLLLYLRKKVKKNGHLFCWYLVLYGSLRFLIEQLREDSLYFLGLRVSCILSLTVCVAAALLLLWKPDFRTLTVIILMAIRWLMPEQKGISLSLLVIVCIAAIMKNGTKKIFPIILLTADTFLILILPPSTATDVIHRLFCSLEYAGLVGFLYFEEAGEEKTCL